jgi:hypothetical protein
MLNLKGLSSPEVLATHLLLGNEEYLPHHMKSQFFQQPNYPAIKLVARLQKLADVNPQYAKKAKPLLDNLNEFFPRSEEGQESEGVVRPGLLSPEQQSTHD